MKHIYLAGPYSHIQLNVMKAVDTAEEIQNDIPDVVVFCPHLYHFWSLYYPHHDENHWLRIDLAWLEKCDAVYRMPGISEGADMEVTRAMMLNIPVFYNMTELIKWSKEEK